MDKNNEKHDGGKLRKEGQEWLERIKESEELEKTWIDNADRAVKVYSCDDPSGSYDFNILYSNVETIVPAIINSPPAPDIRRRFGDADEVAKEFSELVERSIRMQVDDSKLQIELEAIAQDAFLAGRGVVRLRFKADITGEPDLEEIAELAEQSDDVNGDTFGKHDSGELGDDEHATSKGGDSRAAYPEVNGQPDELVSNPVSVSNERITFEAVSWRDYRHGPAKRWEDRKWDAFRHSMPQDDIDEFQEDDMVNAQMSGQERMEQGEKDTDIVIWEIWCRKSLKVKFVKETTGEIIKVIDDPLNLSGFFPIATPVQPVELTGRLMPINPFAVYSKLADELDATTKRIGVLLDAMRVKGWYAGDANDLESITSLDDNEFAPISNAEIWAAHGGIKGAIEFWPLEKFSAALKELYVSREQTKQSIYEITGISDIVRGASKASETLGAQEIKSQWGSLRIQKAQRAMERCARDLFVMMSEIIPDKFSPETLQKMTGVQLIPTQQDLTPVPMPQPTPEMQPEQMQQAMAQAQKAEQERQQKLAKLEQINAMLHEKVTTSYRVDVETDSTVRADLTRQKQEVAEFLKGSGAYFQSVGPLVQQGMLPADVAIEIYASNSRMFNLGKSTEDAIDSMIDMAKEKAKQPPAPNPEAIKAKADLEAQQMDGQIKQQQAQSSAALDAMKLKMAEQEMQGKMQLAIAQNQNESQKAQHDAAIAVLTQQIKSLEVQIKNVDLAIKQTDLQIKQEQSAQTKQKVA